MIKKIKTNVVNNKTKLSDTDIRMPLSTAKWLVFNTKLSFIQIANLCQLHKLEVQGISDGTIAKHILAINPIGIQLTQEIIKECEENHALKLTLATFYNIDKVQNVKLRNGRKFTSVSLKESRPNAIVWLLKNHYNLSDKTIATLVGSTSKFIQKTRLGFDNNDYNVRNIAAKDPILLGFFTKEELDNLKI